MEGGSELVAEKPRLILVDTSVWIDFFSSSPGAAGAELRRMILTAEPFALTGIVAAEVLQGLTRNAAEIEQYLAQWDMLEPSGLLTYSAAASIFRRAREKGITLKTIDTLIAAIAIEQRASVFTLDKDFGYIAGMSNLELYSLPA